MMINDVTVYPSVPTSIEGKQFFVLSGKFPGNFSKELKMTLVYGKSGTKHYPKTLTFPIPQVPYGRFQGRAWAQQKMYTKISCNFPEPN
jgi:hypothetical protein